MKYLYGILIVLSVVFFPIHTHAYCELPFKAVKKNVTPGYECLKMYNTQHCAEGVYLQIVNHCEDDFYFYNESGELDKTLVLVNEKSLKETPAKYSDKFEYADAKIVGQIDRREPLFLKCGESPQPYDSICDLRDFSKYEDGEVVKNWEIIMHSTKNNEDLLISGVTVFTSTQLLSNYIRFSILAFVIFLVLAFIKEKFLRKMSGWVLWPFLILSVALFLFNWVSFFLELRF